MKKHNIITDTSSFNKEDFAHHGQNLVTGCAPTNTNFTFSGTTYTDYKSHFEEWLQLNSDGQISHDNIKVQKAKDMEELAKESYSIVAKQVNEQADHDVAKLKSSGGILTSDNDKLGILPQAQILKIKSEITGEALIKIKTFKKSVGTMVFWKDLTANTPQEKDFFTQKYIIKLDGLISGHQYEIIVAHKGTARKIILSNPVKIYIQ